MTEGGGEHVIISLPPNSRPPRLPKELAVWLELKIPLQLRLKVDFEMCYSGDENKVVSLGEGGRD